MIFFLKNTILQNFPFLKKPLRSAQCATRSGLVKFLSIINSEHLRASRFVEPLSIYACKELDVIHLRPCELVDPKPLPVSKDRLQSPQVEQLNLPYNVPSQYIAFLRHSHRLIIASYSYQRSGGHIFALGLDSGALIEDLSFDIFGNKLHLGLCDLSRDKYEHHSEPCVVVLEPQAPTYGHWLLDFLPRVLMTIDYIKSLGRQLQEFRWFVSGSNQTWEREALQMLGLEMHNVYFVSSRQFASFSDVLIPSFTSKGACNLSPSLLMHFRDTMTSACECLVYSKASKFGSASIGKVKENPRKIYLTRSGEPFRNVLNEDSVIELLRPFGFAAVNSRDLSFAEKVHIFSRCSFLVGVLSSGMSHAIFMKEGTLVVNILPTGYFPPAEARISRCVGVKQIILPVKDSRQSSNRYGDIEVDLEALKSCVANCAI